MKKLYKHLPAVIFGGFISVMLILLIVLPKKDFSSSEKRYLEKAPAFSLSAVFSGQFEKSFENFISDHTAGRNFWVGFNAYFNKAMGNNAPKGVYFGKDGYLINDPCEMTNFSRNAGYLEEFAADVKQRTGTPVTVAVAPSTGYVCADKLPKFHNTYHDDEAFAELQETFKTASFADLRSCLQTAYADGNQVFYRTDHHWTAYGAFTAYRELGSALGYTPNDESAYTKTPYPGFYGTTYSTSGFWMVPSENIEVWDNPANDETVSVTITDGDKVIEQKDMFFYSHLDEDDKYPVYLDGNHPYTVIKNTKATSDKKLMVIKDSFAHSLVPYLADHYSEIIMVDLRYFANPLSDIVEKEKVDQVLVLYSLDNLATDDSVGRIG